MVYEIGDETLKTDYIAERHIDVNCNEHIHSHMEIVYILSGSLTMLAEDREHILNEGKMAIIMPYEIHSYKTDHHSDMFVISFSPEMMTEYKSTFAKSQFENIVCKASPVLKNILNEYIGKEHNSFLAKALIYYSISEFMANSPLIPWGNPEYDVYRKALMYMSTHFTEKITLSQTALHIGVTPVHLSRVLNKRRKSGFAETINSLRIFYAKTMIEQTDYPISYIAFESGYGSIRNFNRIFCKYFGKTPKDMRSQTGIKQIQTD